MLTIIASMERELAGLRREFRSEESAGKYRQPGLEILGMGGAQARQTVTSLLNRHLAEDNLVEPVQALLLLGFAGGVDPSLAPGVLAISPSYHQSNAGQSNAGQSNAGQSNAGQSNAGQSNAGQSNAGNSLQPDPDMWRQAVEAATGAGLLLDHTDSLTVDRPVSTVADKSAIFRRYRVGTVNMEDYPVAAAANDAGVPFLAVRAVLDPASQSLPSYVLAMSRSPVKAALGTAVRPWRITTMLHLARQMRQAQSALTRFALAYLRCSLEEELRQSGAWPVEANTGPAGR